MKPILFNTAMVQAILEGRKTTTRRIIKDVDNNYTYLGSDKQKKTVSFARNTTGLPLNIKISYKAGDILYVRETWKQYEKRIGRGNQCHLEKFYGYKADENNLKNPSEFYDGNWKPSIHMTKEAARIFLKVTAVKVERLKAIEAGQCKKEGIKLDFEITDSFTASEYCNAFGELWDSTLKKDQIEQYGWEANPYVWVIEFERIEKSEVEQ